MEPAFSTAGRTYAEFVIENCDASCCIMLGVTALDAHPPYLQEDPASRMYFCQNSSAYPGGRSWGPSGTRKQGDRVGLLVDHGSLSVYVNGERLGQQAMSTNLPPRVRFAVEIALSGSSVRVVAGARPPT